MNESINKILVIGYYNKNNLGDDAYQGVMGKFFPNDKLVFVGSDKLKTIKKSDYNAVIVGGGDIINNYFNDQISPFLKDFVGPKIAFSIGIPFPSLINDKYFGHFDHIFIRNYEDIRPLQKLMGSHRVHFIPDIVLSYKANHPHKSIISDTSSKSSGYGSSAVKYQRNLSSLKSNKKCGVFLVGNMMEFPKIVEDIAHLISKISLTYNVVLYCFNPGEDEKISEFVYDKVSERLTNSYTNNDKLTILLEKAKQSQNISVDKRKYTAQEMIDLMTDLDFAICMRYHSHIFCTIAGTPFMSISSTRKTRSFMKQAGLSKYQYEIPLNGYCTPIDSDYDDMKIICRNAIHDKRHISRQLKSFLDQSRFLLSSRQASNLIKLKSTDVRRGVTDFINETGDHENGARLLSNYIIGYPDSPYVWGMYEKFKNAGDLLQDVIHDSAQYLMHNGTIIKNELFSYIMGEKSLPIYIDIKEYQSYKSAHRGGWYIACEELCKLNEKNTQGFPNGIICDMYIDRTFHWANSYMKHQGVIPYTGPWCGFIHHTFDTFYSEYNSTVLFEINEFIQSLHTCLALFVLSESSAVFLRNKLAVVAPHVKVVTFSHPIDTPTKLFDMKKYINSPGKLINIGAWMRNPFTIYHIDNIDMPRAILNGKDMGDHIPPQNFKIARYDNEPPINISTRDSKFSILPCRPSITIPRWVIMLGEWLKSLGIHPLYYDSGVLYVRESDQIDIVNTKVNNMVQNVEIIDFQTNDDYDTLLSENVVFLDLIDAAAVNTIIECIVRRTPVVVNKIPGTISLLGDKYPLFYNSIDEISSLLTTSKIKAANKYLKRLDTKRYTIDFFIKHMDDVISTLLKN